jgi:glycosyltransferase involved in cell wall biosynthesis
MISIVIPLLNEVQSLELLQKEIAQVASQFGLELEIIFVDDGSNDGSWSAICEMARHNTSVHGIRFRRNFGKAAALSAGFRQARGDVILTMDADLQDDPREIPHFVTALASGRTAVFELRPSGSEIVTSKVEDRRANEGYDVVSGWKKVRCDPWHKVWASRLFNFAVSVITGVHLHDHNCGMKCYRRQVLCEVKLYGELHRFIPVLAAARGFRVGEIEITHRPRRYGRSKYGMRRFARGLLDLLTVKFLTGFSQRPAHLLGGIGLTSFLAGSLGLLYLGITWLVNLSSPGRFLPLHERPLMVYSVAALLLGAQMVSIGFLAELIIAYRGDKEETYSIAEQTGVRSQESGVSENP